MQPIAPLDNTQYIYIKDLYIYTGRSRQISVIKDEKETSQKRACSCFYASRKAHRAFTTGVRYRTQLFPEHKNAVRNSY